jgi:formylglycine-generating enzyme required for sulfatase activity
MFDGNVWEWCADPWHYSYNGVPNDGRVWDDFNNFYCKNYIDYIIKLLGAKKSQVLHGGWWLNDPVNCRCAYRFRYVAAILGDDSGFRVSCVPPETP